MQEKKNGRGAYTIQEISELSYQQINQIFLDDDESHLYPVFNKFNVTEKAIKNLQQQMEDGQIISEGNEYWLALEGEISNIVNKEF